MMIFSSLAIVAVVWAAMLTWLRGGRRWRVGVVEILRVVLVVVAVALLWQPESTFQIDSDRQDDVVLLIDRSESMQTQDVVVDGETSTRQVAVERILDDPVWQQLNDRFKVVRQVFAEQPGAQSDLGGVLDRAADSGESAAAFVLLSDGDWSGDRSPVQSAAEIAARKAGAVTVFTIAVGDVNRVPDIELVTVDVPTFGVVGKPVRLPFTVRNWFPELREVEVNLQQGNVNVDQQRFQIRAGGRVDGFFTWQSDSAGTHSLSFEVPVDDDETIRENDRITKSIEIRDERLRVLIIEGLPRWEYRYLRNALIRDPGIEVSCLLFHSGLQSVGGGGSDYLTVMPDQASELASYDVVFLGDIGVAPGQLTLEQCRQIRGLVEQQAAGLVLMPGSRGNQASLLQSELGELFPVVIDPARPRGIGGEAPATFALTAAGRSSLLTQLDDDRQANWSVWESLPGFYWHAAATRAKAGSEILAVHSGASNQYGRLPLLVTRSAGAGKVLFMGTDSAWRWRMGVEDKFHYRFWGQAIRWMAYQRNMAVGQTMRLSYRPEQPMPGETVTLRASVMTSMGTPADVDAVAVEVVSPTGETGEVRLEKADAQWGVFVGQTIFDQVGDFSMTLSHPTEQAKVQARIAVQGRAVEQVGRPARPDIMREVARVGGGQMNSPDQIGQLIEQINRMPPAASTTQRIQWWNHPAVMLGMVGGLGLFWVGRKWAGGV